MPKVLWYALCVVLMRAEGAVCYAYAEKVPHVLYVLYICCVCDIRVCCMCDIVVCCVRYMLHMYLVL